MTEVKYNKDGSIRKKVGRPRKNLELKLPDEIQKLVKDVENQQATEFQEILKEEKAKRKNKEEWDIKIGDEIKYFDRDLSYEVTGYKPIDEHNGLDFNPGWFTEARDTKLRTKKYTAYLPNTKANIEFWREEYRRCREGYTVNGYTITGDHYFFLNYYQLKDSRVLKAGTARKNIFPRFMQALYEFFHYFELCKQLRKNVCMMKSRAVEICRLYK